MSQKRRVLLRQNCKVQHSNGGGDKSKKISKPKKKEGSKKEVQLD